MNEHFVNIKVDREERPDIDGIYMQATVAMTGSGGWPMSVFLHLISNLFLQAHTSRLCVVTTCPPSRMCSQGLLMRG